MRHVTSLHLILLLRAVGLINTSLLVCGVGLSNESMSVSAPYPQVLGICHVMVSFMFQWFPSTFWSFFSSPEGYLLPKQHQVFTFVPRFAPSSPAPPVMLSALRGSHPHVITGKSLAGNGWIPPMEAELLRKGIMDFRRWE